MTRAWTVRVLTWKEKDKFNIDDMITYSVEGIKKKVKMPDVRKCMSKQK